MDSDYSKDDLRDGEDKSVVSSVSGTVYDMLQLAEDDDDDEEEEKARNFLWGGSRKGKEPNIRSDFEGAHETLVQKYFSGPLSL